MQVGQRRQFRLPSVQVAAYMPARPLAYGMPAHLLLACLPPRICAWLPAYLQVLVHCWAGLAGWLGWLAWLAGWLASWLAGWLAWLGWLAGWLIGWLLAVLSSGWLFPRQCARVCAARLPSRSPNTLCIGHVVPAGLWRKRWVNAFRQRRTRHPFRMDTNNLIERFFRNVKYYFLKVSPRMWSTT
jgi:hypothetical protein